MSEEPKQFADEMVFDTPENPAETDRFETPQYSPSNISAGLDDLASACDEVDEDEMRDPEEVERDAIKQVNPILQQFAVALTKTPLEKYDQLFDLLDADLRALEKEIGTETIPEGYVAESVLLDSLLQVAAVWNKKLRPYHRLKPAYAIDLAVNLVQNWFRKVWGDAVLHVVNLDVYLDPKKDLKYDYTTLPDSVSAALYEKARNCLAEVESQLNSQLSEEPTEEDPLDQERTNSLVQEQAHLVHVLLGDHAPFNTAHNQRWKSFDLMHIFMPLDQSYTLTPEQTRWTMAIANSLLSDPNPDRSPDHWVPASKALTFIQTGTLPAPWKAHPSFFEQAGPDPSS